MNRFVGWIQLCSGALTVAAARTRIPGSADMQDESRPARLQFAGFVFDGASCELSRADGSRVPLQEQPSQVLAALLDRPGDVVTREDLRDRLWKSDTFVDFEHSLNTAVKKLRQALGDSAEAPTFVETLPRRGYRFIASVAPVSEGAEQIRPLPDVAVPLVAAQTPRVNRTALLITALVTLVVLAGLAWRVQSRPRTTTQLAVMPFRVLADPGGDAAYLGIGIADAITTRLAATRQIGVQADIGGAAVRGVNCGSRSPGGRSRRSAPRRRHHTANR